MAVEERRIRADGPAARTVRGWPLPPRARFGSRFRVAVVGLSLALILAACGDDADDDEPTATAAAAATATAPAGETGPESDGSPTVVAAATTVGDVAARIEAAWTGVTTYRASEVTSAIDDPNATPSLVSSPVASPIAPPGASPAAGSTVADARAIDEVVLPDRKHRRIVAGDEIVSEIVVVAGQVYARGAFVRQYVDPALPAETWVQLDLTAPPPNAVIAEILGGLVAPVSAPLSALSPVQLDLPVNPIGQTVVDGRTCDVYQVAQTTATGERIDVAIGIDATGLPCLIETRAGGQTTLATYIAFNEPLEIAAPAEFVTRAPIGVATPAATPAPVPAG